MTTRKSDPVDRRNEHFPPEEFIVTELHIGAANISSTDMDKAFMEIS